RVRLEQSYGRVLAEHISADQDVPSFDRSPYDGFAIRSIDSAEATNTHKVTFKIVGEIGAGYTFDAVVEPVEAVRSMT
ncbi:MAG: molybdopterin molybdenumtransferase MoeA, partial [Kurthia sp.]